jgi:hypothetical protein
VINDQANELLSRHLDGDLDSSERVDLEQRLATDEELAAELAALRKMRASVAELADGMEPPDELAALLEPLRRGIPPRVQPSRSAARWLVAAAMLALGATVALEVARRSTESDTPIAPRHGTPTSTPPRGVFQLRPLPTSNVPPEEQPLGAVDRLLARPLPEPMPDEPEALEIVGPLSTAPEGKQGIGNEQPSPVPDGAGVVEAGSSTSATVVIRLSGRSVTEQVTLLAPLPRGRYRIRLVTEGGQVVETQPHGPGPPSATRLRSSVIGLELAELADGHHRAELVVGSRSDG